jgi:putative methanogenesis marker protein 8
MYAMKERIIDSAVVVCDGAGTVVVDKPEIVQGIGARMNGLFYTSPIGNIIKRLKETGADVVFPDAKINQTEGIIKAAELGYKKIAVTVNACMDDNLSEIRKIERDRNISVVLLVICTTGITKKTNRGSK